MTVKLQAAIRLKAAFNDAQKQMVRQHLLPQMQELMPPYWYNSMTWLDQYAKGAVSKGKKRGPMSDDVTSMGNYINDALFYMKAIIDVLNAVDGKGSEAFRAATLKKVAKGYGKSVRFTAPPNRYPQTVALKLKRVPSNAWTDKGKKLIEFVNSQYFKLLTKSWPWILQECENEFSAIVKQSKLHMMGAKPTLEKVLNAMKEVLPDWKPTVEERTMHDYKSGKQVPDKPLMKITSPDGLTVLELTSAGGGGQFTDPGFSIKPMFRMDENSGWRSWERFGVDFGDDSFNSGEHSVEYAIEQLTDKIDKARERQNLLKSGGQDFNFGPVTKRMMPEDLEKAIQQLKTRGMWSIEPSGFGTAYVFTTNRSRWDSPASSELSEKVGKPVYFSKQDRD